MSKKLSSGISLLIHTKNEESNILACIASAKSIADEIIVVDMQSSDKTVKLAAQAGAKIFSVPDTGFADPMRNFGIEQANFEWILPLDADERLSPKLRRMLLSIKKENKVDVVKIPRKNKILNKWIHHGMWWPDYQIRFFRNGHLKHIGTVHTQPSYKGEMLTLPEDWSLAIAHYHRSTVANFLNMINIYTSVEKHFSKQLNANGQISPENLKDFFQHEFDWRFIQHKGYLDGLHGLVLSKFMDFYRFLEFAKYWEKHGYPQITDFDKLAKLYLDEPSEIQQLKEQLHAIKSSNFFKLWQFCYNLKNKLLSKLV